MLLFIGYELLTVMLPLAAVYAISAKASRQGGKIYNWRRFLLLCAFGVYIFAAFFFTGAGTVFDLLRSETSFKMNLLPFSNHINIDGYVKNVLLFIPLGSMLPLLWPRFDRFWYAPLFGLGFSLLIEASQFLNHRTPDVDDLIMNTAGAILGYFAYKLFSVITKQSRDRPAYPKYEPLAYFSAMVLGHFLLYNGLGLARVLYGF